MLNPEQLEAFEKVQKGDNILLTGLAGTGKSYTLNHIIKCTDQNIGITAMTGSAAILIGGTTLHSYLGIGIGNKPAMELANMIKFKKRYVYERIKKVDILIIDEISMMNSVLFDLVISLLKLLRPSLPQFIVCGDLFQLPPIEHDLIFKSKSWKSLNIQTIELTKSERHKDDLEFMDILRELRFGRCSDEILAKLKETSDNKLEDPILLYCKNEDVDKINDEKYDELIEKGARSFEYDLKYSCESGKIWAQSCKIPEKCKICVGAQVVLTWNIDMTCGLCNGAKGIVREVGPYSVIVEFKSVSHCINYNRVEHEDNKKTWISFMPLRLAYAITINKSQGMTLDCAKVVLSKGSSSFNYGRSYTALSRVRNLKCIQIVEVSKKSFIAHPDVLKFYE